MTESPAAQRSGPLAGLRVVELAAIGPVPFCGMLLADMGAEILRVAAPFERESASPLPDSSDPINRGRARLSLDLKNPDQRDQLLAILKTADVLMEGFRPGVLERLGLGPDTLHAINPRLVIGRMTGWGQDGPLAKAAGHDPNYVGLSGVLHTLGPADRPPPLPLNLIGDYGGGAMLLVMGLLAALLNARTTGRGQVVDAAMVDGAALLLSPIYAMLNQDLWRDTRGVNILDGAAPFGGTYETKDGKYVVICALEPRFYQALLTGLGLENETLPQQFDTAQWPAMRERFAAIFKTKTRDEWCAQLEGTEACLSPVLSLTEAPQHPHAVARNAFLGDKPMPAPAPRFSATPSAMPPQDIGDPQALIERWRSR